MLCPRQANKLLTWLFHILDVAPITALIMKLLHTLELFSLGSPMKCIIKYLGAHRGNSVQKIPGAKIIIYFPSRESTRLKTAHLIVSLSSGRVRDASQSLLDRKHRKKEKKNNWICSLDGSRLVADVVGWWCMAFLTVWLCMCRG